MKIRVLLLTLLGFLLSECNEKLNILAPYKESVSVYGLINQDDTIQYIRIQRVFLGPGNALSMAQSSDSVYFKPGQVKVSLQRFRNGSQLSVDTPYTSNMEIVLTDTFITTQTGIFNPNQLLFKTNHRLISNSTYKLIIHSYKTGNDFIAQTGLLGDFWSSIPNADFLKPGNTINQFPTYPVPALAIGSTGLVKAFYESPVNSGVCGFTIRLFFTEYGTSGSTPKFIDIPLGTQYTNTTAGGQLMDFSYLGDNVLHNIASLIAVNPNVTHRTADSIRYILSAGGYDVALYNQVNITSTLSQDKPNYTNITGGVGIFSSRRSFNLVKGLDGSVPNRLDTSIVTCKLKFLDYGGNLGSCP